MKFLIIVFVHVLFIAFCVFILCESVVLSYWNGVGSMVFSLFVSGFSLIRFLVDSRES